METWKAVEEGHTCSDEITWNRQTNVRISIADRRRVEDEKSLRVRLATEWAHLGGD